jgi:hypothetical protein
MQLKINNKIYPLSNYGQDLCDNLKLLINDICDLRASWEYCTEKQKLQSSSLQNDNIDMIYNITETITQKKHKRLSIDIIDGDDRYRLKVWRKLIL